MEIIGDRKFVEIPGEKTHELPPLLVKTHANLRSSYSINNKPVSVVDVAMAIVKSEDMIPDHLLDYTASDDEVEKRKAGLAVNLVGQYRTFIRAWQFGDGIVEWIRQCEITFENRPELRTLLNYNVWPHAGRSSFVELLHDKGIDKSLEKPYRDSGPATIDLEGSVGLRLTYRKPPPIGYFSDQFLFYLNSPVATAAYQTWAHDPSCRRFPAGTVHVPGNQHVDRLETDDMKPP